MTDKAIRDFVILAIFTGVSIEHEFSAPILNLEELLMRDSGVKKKGERSKGPAKRSTIGSLGNDDGDIKENGKKQVE